MRTMDPETLRQAREELSTLPNQDPDTLLAHVLDLIARAVGHPKDRNRTLRLAVRILTQPPDTPVGHPLSELVSSGRKDGADRYAHTGDWFVLYKLDEQTGGRIPVITAIAHMSKAFGKRRGRASIT